ncbi:hypothetical protein DLAC_09516 [Tieghemostelium lacteum]|uniref:BRCT domain-containing protein n=1 Tax=Tieghemostelium lacteum TaxID=361077 RepID=A0A151Z6K0_TIELA|nr:hypothetical protein DLAC_09516 [Tieghemostelium lacteum]|eukprot:KYQ89565.1 hypothetical protein DLAC_09516 [Tieghemostelium lacteum]
MTDVQMTEIFEDDVFAFIPSTPIDKDSRDKLSDLIEELGGTISRNITKKTTIVICDEFKDNQSDIEKAQKINSNLKIVKSIYLDECKTKQTKLELSTYILENPNNKNKRKLDDNEDGVTQNGDNDDNHQPQQKKVVKVDHFTEGSVWHGNLIYKSEDHYPFYMTLLKYNDDSTIEGSIEWPDYENAITRFKGHVEQPDKIQWEEFEFIKESDQIELPMKYEATLTMIGKEKKPALKGRLVYDPVTQKESYEDSDLQADFTILKQKQTAYTPSTTVLAASTSSLNNSTASVTPPPTTTPLELPWLLPIMRPMEGVMYKDYPFNYKITKRPKESELEGVIEWNEFNTKTRFKGSIDKEDVTFKEHEIISGDGVELPVDYKGKLNQDQTEIKGTYDYGTFTLTQI